MDIGVGEHGQESIDKYLSALNLQALGEDNGIIRSVMFCNDGVFHITNKQHDGYVPAKCREEILKEFSATEFAVSLLNTNKSKDVQNACYIAQTWRSYNSDVYSVCIYTGNCRQNDLNSLRQVYDQLIFVSTYDKLIDPWLLLINMNRSGWIGLDFADCMAIFTNLSHG